MPSLAAPERRGVLARAAFAGGTGWPGSYPSSCGRRFPLWKFVFTIINPAPTRSYRMQRSAIAFLAATAALAAAFITGTSVARSDRGAPTQPLIAVVRLQQIFNNMAEQKDLQTKLDNDLAQMQGYFNAKTSGVNRKREEANKLPDGAAKEAAIEAAVDEDVSVNLEFKKAKARLEKSQGDAVRTLFDKIQKEAARYGDSNGYTLVMAADDQVSIPSRASAQEATQVMSLRRFLYVNNKAHDVTDEVLKSLNAAYAATKPPAPSPSAPAAPNAPAKP